jgi:hypothetical protein
VKTAEMITILISTLFLPRREIRLNYAAFGSINADEFATSFHLYRVPPSIEFADPFAPSHFTKATRFMKRNGGRVFGKHARLQRPDSRCFRMFN